MKEVKTYPNEENYASVEISCLKRVCCVTFCILCDINRTFSGTDVLCQFRGRDELKLSFNLCFNLYFKLSSIQMKRLGYTKQRKLLFIKLAIPKDRILNWYEEIMIKIVVQEFDWNWGPALKVTFPPHIWNEITVSPCQVKGAWRTACLWSSSVLFPWITTLSIAEFSEAGRHLHFMSNSRWSAHLVQFICPLAVRKLKN